MRRYEIAHAAAEVRAAHVSDLARGVFCHARRAPADRRRFDPSRAGQSRRIDKGRMTIRRRGNGAPIEKAGYPVFGIDALDDVVDAEARRLLTDRELLQATPAIGRRSPAPGPAGTRDPPSTCHRTVSCLRPPRTDRRADCRAWARAVPRTARARHREPFARCSRKTWLSTDRRARRADHRRRSSRGSPLAETCPSSPLRNGRRFTPSRCTLNVFPSAA